ncbi:tetratricopeptide repeat protein [Dasania sp. GY-MA-18]|uniref:Tetratricopeptide repeat protein n=1 Tax=Dasania phycosphaerae TaxID=2950436 RepID=A0A9J6RR38_9GAMM|nr:MULTISPECIES: tetratricopeptide repeat protein [Dasania]MCR8924279.1 tetratricopeptide repeat protein [Dasania sp. GY-MA-18]MCZ0866932.1 tetratricopeptide repeat protein [Dasania phycosphaerae]MCZ0870436.1 tetratricopeptide repeat protein [Dasania phycosphaerae]
MATFCFLFFLCFGHLAAADEAGDYVGSQQCAACHQQAFADWQGSHHQQAMQHASKLTVLGDFNNSEFSYNGIRSTFYKKGESFWVKTDGADGSLQDFKIAYTFGVHPLQQYLIAFDDGRLQALSIAWDSRSVEQGGQRWFHLYPNEQVSHQDALHWTRQSQNWNSQCAECHSTNLQKNYQPASNSYQTTWSEISVGCESCHGPGAAHIQWSKQQSAAVKSKGLTAHLDQAAQWQRHPKAATAHISRMQGEAGDSAANNSQIDHCGRCHSRRSSLHSDNKSASFSEQLLDSHMLSLIESSLYYADGQIKEEVFVHGSFLQSKMHQRGVVCSNCHNPHSLQLKQQGNALCAQCHNPASFDSPEHHHHVADSSGGQCVNCHMPETTYMVVDPRRDHSLRVPRPDISLQLALPNACNQCHQDKSVAWAAAAFKQWYPDRIKQSHFAYAFNAADQLQPLAVPKLAALAADSSQAVIIRASALQRLSAYQDQYSINTALTLLAAPQPLIRVAALQVLAAMPLEQRIGPVWPLLSDPIKAVRLEATRLLAAATVPTALSTALTEPQRQQLQQAVADYLAMANSHADSPNGQLQLAAIYEQLDQAAKAKQAYQHALLLEPDFIPALINFADWYRAQGQDELALPLLLKSLNLSPTNADVHFSLGLLYIRLNQRQQALNHVQQAAELAPRVAHYSYVYGVVLFDMGQSELAIAVLKKALLQHPGHPDILTALVSYLQRLGRAAEATAYAAQLP